MEQNEKMQALFVSELQQREWTYDAEENVITTGVAITEELTALIHILTSEDAYTVMCALDLDIPEECENEVSAFTDLVNMGLVMGGFYVDRQEHLLVFRVSGICIGQMPCEEQVMAAVDYPVEMAAAACDALAAMIGGASADEAYQIYMNSEEE
ncbi:MAG: YbjN domain-containing protein [Oscillospiraceae bacterium]|nr:YbjN domain-containing protein [Oscillospiraceae bacterium]